MTHRAAKLLVASTFLLAIALFASTSAANAAIFENSGHSMTAGDFGVAYVHPTTGNVMVSPGQGRAPVAFTSNGSATHVMAANLDGTGGDELVYIRSGALYYHNFTTATTSGPWGASISDLSATSLTGGPADKVLVASAGSGYFFTQATNTFAVSGGGFSDVTSGDFVASNTGGEYYVRNSVSNVYYGNPVTPAETSIGFTQTIGGLTEILGGNFLGNDATDEIAGRNASNLLYIHSGFGPPLGSFANIIGSSGSDLAVADFDVDGTDELHYLGTGINSGQVFRSVNGATGTLLSVGGNFGFDEILGAGPILYGIRTNEPGMIYVLNSDSTSFLQIVPEPSTASLLGLGLLGLVACRRRGGNVPAVTPLLLAATFLFSSATTHAAMFTAGVDANWIGTYNSPGVGGAFGYVKGTYGAFPATFGIELDQRTGINSFTIDQIDAASRHRIRDVTVYTSPTTSFQVTLTDTQAPQTVALPPGTPTSYLLMAVNNYHTTGSIDDNPGIVSLSVDTGPTRTLTNFNAGISPVGVGQLLPGSFPITRATDGLLHANGGTTISTFFTRNAGQDSIQVTYADMQFIDSIGVGFDATATRDLPRFATLFYDGGSEQIDFAGDYLQYGRYSLSDRIETSFLRLEFPEGSDTSNWFIHGDANYGLSEFQAFLAVPEPSTIALLGLGLIGLVSRRRRLHKAAVVSPLVLVIALFASISTAPAATVFTGGDAGEGLDLTGHFVHAYNIGDAGIPTSATVPWSVQDVIFGNDLSNSNFSHNFASVIDTWTANNFGASANDNNLERVMNSIHHSPAGNVANIQLGNLIPGKQYKVQMLFTESTGGSTRNFDVLVNGVLVEDNFKPNAVMTGSGTPTNGAVVTHTFTASSSTATVTLDGPNALPGDQNPTLSGITLEDLSGGLGKNAAYGKRVIEASGSYNGNTDGTINNAGFSAQHVTDGSNSDISAQSYWLGKNGDPTEYFVIDLGSVEPISYLELLNAHNATFNDRGTLDFEVYGSSDLATITGLVPTADLILSNTLTNHSLSGLGTGEIPADIFGRKEGFTPGLYRYLRFESLTAINDHAGLNEFRAITGSVPEPSTALMLALGLIGLVSRRQDRGDKH